MIFQPQYRGRQRWQSVLGLGVPKPGGAARKKAIVALARQLAVDLWRIATGRVQAADLGLRRRPPPAGAAPAADPNPTTDPKTHPTTEAI